MKNNRIILSTLAALVAQIIFGFSFMFTKISLGYAGPMTVIADRYIAAFAGMAVVMLFKRVKLRVNKNIWKLILLSVFQPVLYFVFETYGIKLTTSAFSSVMIALIPVVAMICGIFTLKENPCFLQYVFAVVSVVGVVIITISGNTDGTVTPLGVLLLFGAVVSSAGFNLASRKLSAEYSAIERTFAMTVIGLVTFFVIAVFENSGDVFDVVSSFAVPEYTLSVAYLGIVSSVVAFIMLNYANTHLPVAKTTVFSNFTTVVSVIAGAVFLDEKITLLCVGAIIMIIVGVCGVQMADANRKS